MLRKVTHFILWIPFFIPFLAQAEIAYNIFDPLPHFSTEYAQDYLKRAAAQEIKGTPIERHDRFSFAISPFYEDSTQSRDLDGNKKPFWDYRGRWDMVGLIYGSEPSGQTWGPILAAARAQHFDKTGNPPLYDTDYADSQQYYGFFSVEGRSKKIGIRFDIEGRILNDIGITFKTGLVSLKSSSSAFNNQTASSSSTYDATDKTTVNQYLMDQFIPIFTELGYNTDIYDKTTLEDLRFELFWKHLLPVDQHKKNWAPLIFEPFLSLQLVVPTATKVDYADLMGLSSGNNGFGSVGFVGGINLDFMESVEFGITANAHFYFKRTVSDLPVPTSTYQYGIFPFRTAAKVRPGISAAFEAHLNAYHIIGHLSLRAEYECIWHAKDSITLVTPDSAFVPSQLEHISAWNSQFITTALNYDITPNFALGFLWQANIMGGRIFKANTFMGSIIGTF